MGIKINDFFGKIKSDKKLKFTLVFTFVAIISIAFSGLITTENKTSEEECEVYSSKQYTDYIEEKLEKIVSSIDGAGKSKIMITLESGEENIYAKESKSQNEDNIDTNKSVNEYEYVILKSSSSKEEGMLLKVVEPDVRGVAIVCEGGDNLKVKESIISAVCSVLDIKTNKISITKMKTD